MWNFSYLDGAKLDALTGVEIPECVTNRQEIFDALSSGLNLPDYFNDNWDSLEECIRDLSWISGESVVLIHRDLPMVCDAGALKIYLEILSGAVERNSVRTVPQLKVVFPLPLKVKIDALMR